MTEIATLDFFRTEYTIFYCLLITIALFSLKNDRRDVDLYLCLALCLVIGCITGLRDVDVGKDTLNYYRLFWSGREIPGDLFFSYIIIGMKLIGIEDPSSFILVMSVFISISLFLVCKEYSSSSILMLLGFLSVAYMFDVFTNIFRQGISLFLMLYAIKKMGISKPKFIFSLIISLAFHSTSALLLICFIASKYIKKPKYFIALFVVCSALGVLGVSAVTLLKAIPLDLVLDARALWWISGSASRYFDTNASITGLLAINFIFLAIMICARKFFVDVREDKLSDRLFKTYLLLSSLLALSGDFPFPDRIGVISWVCVPLVLRGMTMRRLDLRLIYLVSMSSMFLLWSLIRSYY